MKFWFSKTVAPVSHARVKLDDYNYATLQDRFAERAMVTLLQQEHVGVNRIQLDLDTIADEAYRMSSAMMQARARARFAFVTDIGKSNG